MSIILANLIVSVARPKVVSVLTASVLFLAGCNQDADEAGSTADSTVSGSSVNQGAEPTIAMAPPVRLAPPTRISPPQMPIVINPPNPPLEDPGPVRQPPPVTDPAPPPATPPATPTLLSDADAASRFLMQATFGPNDDDIDELVAKGYSQWMLEQFSQAPSVYGPTLKSMNAAGSHIGHESFSKLFIHSTINGEDQLRLRMSYALSQILVVSDVLNSPLHPKIYATGHYADIISRNAFGNYRDLLEEVVYSPAMAYYLTYLGNRREVPETGALPDENFAREIMQLFTIGLVELNEDGTPKAGEPETYTNDDIVGLSRVFTGISNPVDFWRHEELDTPDAIRLAVFPEYHSTKAKSFLGLTIPAGTDGETSIEMALDHLIAHPNVGPFIGRQLIQRLVTSNPTPAYVQRVAHAFDRGTFELPNGVSIGEGRRGDLAATLSAILFDDEARQDPSAASVAFGKVREPYLRFTHWARAFGVTGAREFDHWLVSSMDQSDRFAQSPYEAGSVFNFYRPGYMAPGSMSGDAGLVAPEMQIANETSIPGYINMMDWLTRDWMAVLNGLPETDFAPWFSEELTLAQVPADLIEHLDTVLTAGQMSAITQERIQTVLSEVQIRDGQEDEDLLRRVQVAVHMATTSPAYIVQR